MSRTIDSRVVEMQFDNKQFESNVKATMSTLDKLKQSLNLTGSYDSMSGLSRAVESVRMQFSTLEVMAVTTLANITNSAINAGKRIVSALTIEPISEGFGEYELKMGSIQTIMAGTGESLETVNKYLDELNTYADRTIYSFADMTSNIGKFTNAGVSLKDAVAAIQGVSNVAAVSGANANEASRAMYNFAQALSAGYVKLIDWKSIENANMATVEFKNQLIETAVAAGTVTKTADGMYKTLKGNVFNATRNFNDVLQDQWMTTEVLVETLGKYADETTDIGKKAFAAAQDIKTLSQLFDTLKEAAGSGWAQTWEILIGDFEEAKKILTELGGVIGGFIDHMSDARNELLSGALSSGWKQLMEHGISDSEDFKQTIAAVAKEHGISVEKMVEDAGSFEKSLKNGWLTSDILSESIEKLTEKFDGLSEEEIAQMGYTIENVEALKKLNSSVKDGSVSMEEFAEKIKSLSGREMIFESLFNIAKGIGSVLKPIGEAFRDIFSPTTSEQLHSFIVGLHEFTKKLKISDETAQNIKSTFKGFFALLDIVKMALTAVISVIGSLVRTLFPVTDSFLTVTGGVGDFIVAIRDALKSSDAFGVVMQNIGKVLKPVAEGIVMFTDLIANAFKAVRVPDMSGIDEFTGQMEKSFQPLIKLGEAFKSFLSFFYNLGSTIGEILSRLSASIFKSLNDSNFNSIFDFINSGLFAAILYGIKKFIDSLTNITDSAGGFLSGITGIFDGVRGCLEAYQSNLKAGVLLKIATSIGILAAALLTISMIDSEKLTTSLAAMTAMFVELFGAMAVFNAIAGVKGSFAISTLATGMIGLSIAILILASAMKKLSSLDWNGVAKGLAAIAGLTGILVGATKLLETSSKSLIAVSMGFVIFGTAILILTQAVKQLGGLDLDDLAKGLVGVGVLMAELVLFMKVADLSGMGAIKSVGILLLAAAITVLADAVKKLSSINLGDLVKGLSGLAVMLTSIAIFINVAGNAKNVIATAASLTILSVAMNLFAAAIIKMGSMSWEEMGRGLISFGSALGVVTLALIALPKDIFIKSLALMDVAGAMLLLSQALKAFSSMSWEEIAKSLTSLTVSLGVIIGAFVLLSKTSSIVDALAFSVLAASITILAGALKTIGSMSLAQIGIALIGLAGAFTVIGVAATLLTPAIPAILGLAAAIALLGVGVAAIGGGILALSAGLSALAVAGTAGTVALVALVTGLIGLIPTTIKMIGEGIVAFAEVIAGAGPTILDAITTVLTALIDAIIAVVPKAVDAFLLLMTSLLESLVKYMPQIMESGKEILISFLEGIAKMIPDVIQAGIDIIISLIDGLAQGIEKNAPRIRDAFINLFKSLLKAVLVFLGINSPSKVFTDIGMNIIQGLINGIGNMLSNATKAIVNVVTSLISAITNKMGEFLSKGKEAMTNFQNGISNKLYDVKNAATDVISNVLSGIRGKLSEFTSMGSNLIHGLKTGIQNAADSVVSAAKGVVSDAISAAKNLLGIHSPSKVFADIGKYSDEGFIQGLKSYSSKVVDASEDVGKSAINGISRAISGITDILNSDMDMRPTIRPVLDLTDVQAGKKSLYNMFSDGLNVAGTNRLVSSMLNEIKSDSSTLGSLIDALSNKTKAENQNVFSFEGMFKGAEFNVRSDSDITKIAKQVSQEIFKLNQSVSRGRGLASI